MGDLPGPPSPSQAGTGKCQVSLNPGESQILSIDGKELALFNVEGKLYAIDSRCPHRGGPLARGRLEQTPEGLAVRCPLHGWLFDLDTGKCLNQPQAKVGVYCVHAQDGEISLTPLA